MNFVKLFPLFLLTAIAIAETPFSVTAPPVAPSADKKSPTDSDTLAGLKQKAVANWLQKNMGDRFAPVESQITADFAERYILNYKLGRSAANPDWLELSGYLDEDSLRKWVRLTETKGKGSSQLRPLYLLTSSLPGLSLKAGDTLESVRDTALGKASLGLLTGEFLKLNSRPIPATGSFSFLNPPKDERGTTALRDSAARDGANTAVWLNLTQCSGCDGPRVDLYLYSFSNLRLVTVQSEEIALAPKDYGNLERIQELLKPIFQAFHQELESVITEERLTAVPLRVSIEGVDSYRVYKQLEVSLGKIDTLRQVVPKAFSYRTAEFEGMTTQSAEDLARRIQQVSLGRAQLKTVRIDSRGVVMRYLP